jgi:hypothetical protein
MHALKLSIKIYHEQQITSSKESSTTNYWLAGFPDEIFEKVKRVNFQTSWTISCQNLIMMHSEKENE